MFGDYGKRQMPEDAYKGYLHGAWAIDFFCWWLPFAGSVYIAYCRSSYFMNGYKTDNMELTTVLNAALEMVPFLPAASAFVYFSHRINVKNTTKPETAPKKKRFGFFSGSKGDAPPPKPAPAPALTPNQGGLPPWQLKNRKVKQQQLSQFNKQFGLTEQGKLKSPQKSDTPKKGTGGGAGVGGQGLGRFGTTIPKPNGVPQLVDGVRKTIGTPDDTGRQRLGDDPGRDDRFIDTGSQVIGRSLGDGEIGFDGIRLPTDKKKLKEAAERAAQIKGLPPGVLGGLDAHDTGDEIRRPGMDGFDTRGVDSEPGDPNRKPVPDGLITEPDVDGRPKRGDGFTDNPDAGIMRDQEQSAVWNGASQTGRFVKGDQIMEDQEQAVMTGASQTGASDVTEKDRTQSFASDAGNMSNWKKALDEKNGDSVPSAIREGETTAAERLGLKDADKSFTELADLENTRPAYDSLPNIGDKEQAELERHMNGASLLSADTVPIPTGSDEIGSDMFREKSLDELTSTMAGGVALDDNIARIPEDVMNELDMPDQKNNETLNALGNVDTDALARGMATGFTQTPLDIPRDIMPDSPQDITPGDATIASVLPKSAPERREEETMRSATQLGYSELRAIEIDDSRRAALQEVLNNQKLDTLYRDSIERDIAQGTITPREITRLMSEKDLDDATKQKLFKAFQNPSSPPPNIPPDILGNNSRPNT